MTPRQTAINTAVVLGIICGAYVLYRIRLVVFLMVLAILLSAAIEPLVFSLRRLGAKRTYSILLIYLLIALTIGISIFFGQHVVVEQAQRLIQSYPELISKWMAWAKTIKNEWIRTTVLSELQSLARYTTPVEALGVRASDIALYAIETLVGVITVFVLCFYWITEKPLLRRFLLSWSSEQKREVITSTWNNVELKLGGWTRGQFILCATIGLGAFVGYLVMGVPYAFLLAVWAAVTEIIPLAGPYLGIIPAMMIAMQKSLLLGVIVGVYGIALQFTENNFLVPRIMNKTVGLTPLTVMLSLMSGGLLLGIPGALLAVPVAAAVEAFFEEIVDYEEEKKIHEAANLVLPPSG
jgi:predicted PurR-regulated permease PerM